jgi:dTMP kinase
VKKKKGKLIVIDGTDGSGKATQVKLLHARLTKEGHTVKLLDFPEYYKNFFGGFIAECLSEPKYNFAKLDPKIASVLYAADRFESKKKTEDWLSKGYVVIANRYVSANQIHQAGKIDGPKERKEFLTWLDTMEHTVFGIPRPDIVVYLSLPISLTQKLMATRDAASSRKYLASKKDVHESDAQFLENSRKSALKLVSELNHFVKIECTKRGGILSKGEVHEMVYETVRNHLKI